ncbi:MULTISPECIES: thioredoxin [Micrococcales]|uniref:thioredoxin n=1 Tax=Micrococcales TaxID=85006 RepID=UPI000C8E7A02|nr:MULTISPECIES: thioredoxin [Micrococcales]MAG57643.1 thioredoxin [Planctomycetota bacterium]NJE67095.1 thioredoxin [Brevibacterium sp. LS14]PZP30339.1 MAG: thioredoxin [Kocuria rhizophila]PZU00436.1 MAG: thioredoxin [Gordonia sp. (in: high G+C Gram-positive bacteria)]MCT1767417.1 thioredoxin [Brevibacterium casei]
MSEVTTVDTQTFDEVVLQSDVPVLVDFWAAWCGPCRAIAPVLDQIAAEQDGKLLIAKLNVDENPDIASRYNISSIPAMKVFDKGEIVREIIGAMPKPQIEQRLEGII